MTLKVQDLAVERGGVTLLSGVTFDVQPGGALILRGANGIGKTSLLRSLAGLQPVSRGVVEADADEIAYASHADGVKAALSVQENLQFWAEVYGQPFNTDVLDWFDLTELVNRAAGTLSAGQKRRLGLARLGVIGRKILLLDEPTVSLDAESVRRFSQFLKEQHLAKGGIAVVATHIELGLEAPELALEQFITRADTAISDEAFL